MFMNKVFIYFSANKLISKNQSGFQPGDSVSTNCYQLLTKFLHHLIMD